MRKKDRTRQTVLNDHDRKVLDKYTKHYTNYIESSTAEKPPFEKEFHKPVS